MITSKTFFNRICYKKNEGFLKKIFGKYQFDTYNVEVKYSYVH